MKGGRFNHDPLHQCMMKVEEFQFTHNSQLLLSYMCDFTLLELLIFELHFSSPNPQVIRSPLEISSVAYIP